MSKIVLGVFNEREEVEEAITELKDRDFNPKDISIVMKDTHAAEEIAEDTGAGDVVEGTVTGATTGAVLGGLAGLLASYALPGLGAFFIGGPIAAALGLGGAAASAVSGAVTGAAAGGLIGGLTSAFGLSEEDAKVYQERIESGAILLAVPARNDEESVVKEILETSGADNVKVVTAPTDEDIEDMPVRDRAYDSSMYAGVKGGKRKAM